MPKSAAAKTVQIPTNEDEATPSSVDPASAEELLGTAHLGQRIRRLRLKRSMGLVELGKLTGLSASFLSQLETGRVVPTLRNLARLALVFQKDLSFFFQPPEQSAPDGDYIAESVGILIPEGGVRPCMAELLPGVTHSFQPHTYPGTEMVYVTSGSIEIHRNGEMHLLGERDVAYLGGETHRVYRCGGDQPATALIISFDGETRPAQRPSRRPVPAGSPAVLQGTS